jgi:hypothetical protein
LFVLDVGGGAPGKGPGRGMSKTTKAATAATAARTAALTGGTVGVGVSTAALLGYVAWQNAENNYPTRGATPAARQAQGTVPPAGFGTGTPGALNVSVPVTLDGRQIARASATYTNIETGRLIATRAARK